MSNEIVPSPQSNGAIVAAGKIANGYAAGDAFNEHRSDKAQNTLDAQRTDLVTFAEFLCAATDGADCPTATDLSTQPSSWRGVTWGLVKAFCNWMLAKGYATGSVNRKLATVRKYAELATQAGAIDEKENSLIHTVKGFSGKRARNVDKNRIESGLKTRTGAKKGAHVSIEPEQAAALKAQPDTPQGRRDAVLMALLLDHGLRVGELAALQLSGTVIVDQKPESIGFNLKRGTFRFFRPKVDKVQTHKMTADTHRAVAAWLATDAPAIGALLRGSRKGGHLTAPGMSERAISERVRVLGEAVGLHGLSAHDCRHYWASRAAGQGTDTFALRDAGGWSSLAMPSRYVEASVIANERVKL